MLDWLRSRILMMRPSSALLCAALDASHDAIAMHGLGQVRGGNVNVIVSLLGDDKAKAARIGGELPDDEIHLLGQTEPIAADLQQIARGDHALQLTLEAGALFARYAKQLYQLPRGGRVMDRLANALEQILIATQRG